jgi:hypothetical protein
MEEIHGAGETSLGEVSLNGFCPIFLIGVEDRVLFPYFLGEGIILFQHLSKLQFTSDSVKLSAITFSRMPIFLVMSLIYKSIVDSVVVGSLSPSLLCW